MNHDYAHCMDYTEDCPKECFRGQLVRDLDGVPISRVQWVSFKGTEECKKKEVTTPPECEGDCGWCKPSVIEKCKGVTE